MSGRKGFSQLTEEKRDRLFALRRERHSMRECARQLGVDPSTISRELKRNSSDVAGGSVYLPDRAQNIYRGRRKPCHPHVKMDDPAFRKKLMLYIQKGWSPETIAGRLEREQKKKVISYETLYKFIYESEIGKRDKLYEYLPRGKKKRSKKHGRKSQRSRLEGRVFIEARSSAANERSEIGHWESDSLVCKSGNANVLAERAARAVRITKLAGRDARATTTAVVARLENEVVLSVTADNGPENAEHEMIATTLSVDYFFCHPYHSWEKGTVENRNGVIRRYLPRSADLSRWTQEELDEIAEDINNTPMKCLDYQTPNEVLQAQCCI